MSYIKCSRNRPRVWHDITVSIKRIGIRYSTSVGGILTIVFGPILFCFLSCSNVHKKYHSIPVDTVKDESILRFLKEVDGLRKKDHSGIFIIGRDTIFYWTNPL